VTDDRQTDHAMKKCVGMGSIVCTARGVLLNPFLLELFCDLPSE